MKKKYLPVLISCLLLLQCKKDNPKPTDIKIADVKTWMYQLQNLDDSVAVNKLSKTNYDMLVLEPGDDLKKSVYNTSQIINQLRFTADGKRRLLIAYIDIGEAEDYRSYWKNDWIAPTVSKTGYPDFLLTVDPDGWSGNYPVAYWNNIWKSIWISSGGRIQQIASLGFDGIYLDWVEGYDNKDIKAAAAKSGVIPEKEMLDFIEEMRKIAKKINPDFLIIQQNAPLLINYDSNRLVTLIDALAVEDTWFGGAGDAKWTDPLAGDIKNNQQDEYSTGNRLTQYKKYLTQNIPVFSVDYCIAVGNARLVYLEARKAGLIPLVTRVSLSRLTETPPYNFP